MDTMSGGMSLVRITRNLLSSIKELQRTLMQFSTIKLNMGKVQLLASINLISALILLTTSSVSSTLSLSTIWTSWKT